MEEAILLYSSLVRFYLEFVSVLGTMLFRKTGTGSEKSNEDIEDLEDNH